MLRSALTVLPILCASLFCAALAHAQSFKFSNEDPAEKADRDAEATRQARAQAMLATPCRDNIKNQKIMVVLGEERNGRVFAGQSSYGGHVSAINRRLQALGLRTFTPEEIRAQVAQAEIDAFFRNDPDAALSASRRMSAQYILRGLITTQTTRNAIVNVNQVHIRMDFTLTGANGRMVSQAQAQNASYAGSDTSGMAITLINERADEVVGQLYSDYCRKAGIR